MVNLIQTLFANERILDSIKTPAAAAAGMQAGIFRNARPGFHSLIVDTVGLRAPLITPPASLSMCAPLEQGPPQLKRSEDDSSRAEPQGLEPRWPYNRQRKRMVDRQSSNKQLRKPQKTNPRLDPDTKRPLSDRDRGGWLLPALIIGIMVAGIAIFAFGNHMPTTTSPAPDTATGQSSRAPGSTPEGPPPVNR